LFARVRDGVPHQRTSATSQVVPQVAEWIGRRILEAKGDVAA
jgi:hypothetical protein